MNKQSNQEVIKFQGVDILTFTKNGEHLIAIKPLCEQFGISWSAQLQKLKRHDLLSSSVTLAKTIGADGKSHEMTCLPLKMFPMWVANIQRSRLKDPKAAEIILAFQRKAMGKIYEHFYVSPGLICKTGRQEIARENCAAR